MVLLGCGLGGRGLTRRGGSGVLGPRSPCEVLGGVYAIVGGGDAVVEGRGESCPVLDKIGSEGDRFIFTWDIERLLASSLRRVPGSV